MNKLSPEIEQFVGNVHSTVEYWLKQDYPDIKNLLHQVRVTAQKDANEQGFDDFVSTLAGHGSDVNLSTVRQSFRQASDTDHESTLVNDAQC